MVLKDSRQHALVDQGAFFDFSTSIKKILITTNLFNPRENNSSSSYQSGRKITQKMRNKLISWLQKLCISVFGFQRKTLITAIIILDQFLSMHDEDPSSLQMVGCASLLISSKLRQMTIVAVDCYLTASCKIFTKDQLLEKQRFLYSKISLKKVAQGPQRLITRACIILDAQSKQEGALFALNFAISKKSSNLYKLSDLVSFCLSCSLLELQANQQLLSLIL